MHHFSVNVMLLSLSPPLYGTTHAGKSVHDSVDAEECVAIRAELAIPMNLVWLRKKT